MPRLAILLALCLPGPLMAQADGAQNRCSVVPPTQGLDLGGGDGYGNGFYRVNGTAPPARRQAAHGLEFELRGPSTVRRGRALGLSLRVTNHGSDEAVVMRSMDGSTEHMRDPSYDLYIRRIGSTTTHRWDFHGGRCGMTNPVMAEDYVRIAPGETNDTLPGPWDTHLHDATLSVRGHYEAWLVYRLCGDIRGFGGPAAPGPAPTTGEYASNPVRFRVR